MNLTVKTISVAVLTILCVSYALGSVIIVPDDQATIQEGIDVAVNGDTVLVDDNIYTGEINTGLSFHGKEITVKSINGLESCIIDGAGASDSPSRAVAFAFGEGSELVF